MKGRPLAVDITPKPPVLITGGGPERSTRAEGRATRPSAGPGPRSKLLLLTGAVLLLGAVSACGGNSTGDDDATAPTEAAGSSNPADSSTSTATEAPVDDDGPDAADESGPGPAAEPQEIDATSSIILTTESAAAVRASPRISSVVELDDGRIAATSWDTGLFIWDPANPGPPVEVVDERSDFVAELPSGQIITGGTNNHAIIDVWSLDDLDEPAAAYYGHQIEGQTNLRAMTPLADGFVASGGPDETIHVWDPTNPGDRRSANTELVYTGHTETAATVATISKIVQLADGRIASAGGNTIHVWSRSTPDEPDAVYLGHTDNPNGVVEIIELSDGRIASNRVNRVHLWDPADVDAVEIIETGHRNQVAAMVQLGDGRIASAGADGSVTIWNPTDFVGTEIIYTGHSDFVYDLIELGDGRIASVAGHEIHIWDPPPSG